MVIKPIKLMWCPHCNVVITDADTSYRFDAFSGRMRRCCGLCENMVEDYDPRKYVE